ncbi:MAG: group II intron reverse transcriptase/maturase, partial [Candidatus Aenigmarchaeota archaeon]|nr:group II intron reverse transcriptase/maturase [Candidatus Aenigmarchaeota archaeon]
ENGKTRPIGIPTIYDRVIQMLVKTALESEWECKFHRNSFGFRPGRCCQDAIEVIKHTIIRKKGEYILDADLSGCFDNIAHAPLLQKLHIFKQVVEKWLKAGVIIKNRMHCSVKGTPQGGIISPLLANIALNKLDFLFNRIVNFRGKEIPLTLVRYADDMVILCSNKVLLSRIGEFLPKILAPLGLELNKDKTYMVHKNKGFSFLGFYLIQHADRWLWIMPDKDSIKRVLKKLKWFLKSYKQAKTDTLIFVLNRIILGWARYYQYCRIYGIFRHMDALIFRWSWRWCYRRHPKKNKQWIRNKYFKTFENRTWVMSGDTWQLSQFFDIKHKKYMWRVGNRSYLNPSVRRLWKQEKTYNLNAK